MEKKQPGYVTPTDGWDKIKFDTLGQNMVSSLILIVITYQMVDERPGCLERDLKLSENILDLDAYMTNSDVGNLG